MRAKSYPIWHPLLFALFPVLFLFNHNAVHMSLGVLGAPLAVVVAAAAALWGVLTLIFRNAHKAGLISACWWLLFFSYGHLASPLRRRFESLFLSPEAFTLSLNIVLAFMLFLAVVLVSASRRDLRPVTGGLNLVSAVLAGIQLVGLVRVQAARIMFQMQPLRVSAPAGAVPDAGELPNIYLIVLDGYARGDVLRDLYGHDNEPFLAWLEQQGFFVARHSRANYCQTALSLASLMEMNYLDRLAEQVGRDMQDRMPLTRTITESGAALRLLRRHGYRIVAVESEYEWTQFKSADMLVPLQVDRDSLSEFSTVLLETTPLSATDILTRLPGGDPKERHRQAVRLALQRLPRIATDGCPAFVFAHIVCPHPPFVFDARGNRTRWSASGADGDHYRTGNLGEERYRQAYAAQITYLTGRVQATLDSLLRRADRPSVVILLSDHGPGSRLRWEDPARTDMRERFGTLLAIRMPDGKTEGLYDAMTPVNVFPAVFNRYLRAQLPRRPDRSYFSSWTRPYRLSDVTSRLP